MASRFKSRKQRILEQLEAPEGEYHDLSPKGSIDEPIRPLIDEINRLDGLVTTSSCSGRISVFLEGRKLDASADESHDAVPPAGPGGKGGGGTWLFISHNPVQALELETSRFMSLFGSIASDETEYLPNVSFRYIHLKFEPMILHILTASIDHSQRLLTAALAAGFRESGAVSLSPSKTGELNPLVAVRSTGYSFDAIVGYQNEKGENIALVDEKCLGTLVRVANQRFDVNAERIARFQAALLDQYTPRTASQPDSAKPEWEDAEARKTRKREEGLARQRALREASGVLTEGSGIPPTKEGALSDIFDQ